MSALGWADPWVAARVAQRGQKRAANWVGWWDALWAVRLACEKAGLKVDLWAGQMAGASAF
jgi:hypothetical protein